ncbi:uncharacterized protein BDW43DRAFT_61195 [Aspergillus alliaceus]|uniref:uncharacterized protein n=1 Tax=Petromyces alliaceus TaxID=209559 RepID=UPI0012A77792|nr:uncharacterized protein BDW43DRAFT_61195 [Aspergillus alliaceus]KAB8234402.1 hypothetical protein BDW43DRAFT_61195 [Aspergillus alliaceus]
MSEYIYLAWPHMEGWRVGFFVFLHASITYSSMITLYILHCTIHHLIYVSLEFWFPIINSDDLK